MSHSNYYVTLVAFNLPLDITSDEVAALLWAKIGLKVDPLHITCRNAEYSANAFFRVTAAYIVELLNRNFSTDILEGQRAAVRFERKEWKGDPPRLKVSSVTFELPDGKEPTLNKHGLPILS